MARRDGEVLKRAWAFVLYPESAPEDWVDILQKTGIMFAVSPLHDKDTNPDGEVKKAHYHIILVWQNTTTYTNVKRLTDMLSQPIPQPLEQVRGYYRYLTHADNPEKYQYDECDIKTYNGFDITDFVDLSISQIATIKRQIQTLILERKIVEYADLMDILLRDEDHHDWYDVASNNTLFFTAYLSSRRNCWRAKNDSRS